MLNKKEGNRTGFDASTRAVEDHLAHGPEEEEDADTDSPEDDGPGRVAAQNQLERQPSGQKHDYREHHEVQRPHGVSCC